MQKNKETYRLNIIGETETAAVSGAAPDYSLQVGWLFLQSASAPTSIFMINPNPRVFYSGAGREKRS